MIVLTETEIRVLNVVSMASDAGRIAYAGDIAEVLELPEEEVEAAMDTLLKHGLISLISGTLN